MSGHNDESFQSVWHNAKTYIRLYAENMKLLSIEKSTLLLSGATLAFVLLLFVIISFFFISIGLIYALAEVIPVMWCFLIMGGLYLLLAALAFILRDSLFVNPIARFVSRLFIDDPEGSNVKSSEDKAQS